MRIAARKLTQLLLGQFHAGCLAGRSINSSSQWQYGTALGGCLGLTLAPTFVRTVSATAGTAIAAALASHAVKAGSLGMVASKVVLLLMRLRAVFIGSIMIASLGAAARYYDDFLSLISSAPRTLRTVVWALKAGAAYKHFHATAYLNGLTPQEFQDALCQLHTHWAHRLLAVCRANGGVYVKAGQFASAFGAVPREYRSVLSQLEDRAVPRPYCQVRKALQRELGCDPDNIFASFQPDATAAASLAQVHRAVLASGEVVAVKVQYPGLARSVTADLATIQALSRVAQTFFPAYCLNWLYDELEAKLAVELDFRNEQSNATRFAALVDRERMDRVHAPKLYTQYCTSKIITMEWIDGYKVTDLDSLQRARINPRAVGLKLVRLFGELMFLHGYVHGDPHPGNVMVRPVGKPWRFAWLFGPKRQDFELVLLDHGVYIEVDDVLREQFCQLWCAIMIGDERTQTDVASAMGGERAGKVLPVLLTHKAKTREEERELQRKVGINNFGDITQLLATASRALVDVLRINTVIRGTSNLLGVTMAERIHMYSGIAIQGLPRRGAIDKHMHSSFQSVLYRLQLHAVVVGIGAWTTSRAAVSQAWELLLSVFGEALFD